jgi:hypothetical protein
VGVRYSSSPSFIFFGYSLPLAFIMQYGVAGGGGGVEPQVTRYLLENSLIVQFPVEHVIPGALPALKWVKLSPMSKSLVARFDPS